MTYYFKMLKNDLSNKWPHDTQHNDIQHNDTYHNDTQHKGHINDTQHKRHSV